MNGPYRPRPHTALLATLIVFIVIADQLSKAWFVYHLGFHKAPDFLSFCQTYFTQWAGWSPHADGAVIRHYFPFKPPEVLWPPHWVQWQLVTNTGAAWSIMAGNSFALSGVSAIMAVALCVIWNRYFRFNLAMTWALGAIIGGALGNFADRFRLHEVVDFIAVQIPYIARWFPQLGSDPYQFPIFNIADSCAVCGTIALALYLVVSDVQHMRKKQQPKRASAPAYTDPTELSAEEKASKVAEAQALNERVRSGEQFLPKSRTDLPLGLGSDERRADGLRHSSSALDEEPNDQFTPQVGSHDEPAPGARPHPEP
jgi:signal peptidase II